ncbi:MAG: cytochrome P450 [Methylobacter sp.]|nr:MAG: cytochrome P450 [Methylobacter sp.]
MLIYLVRLITNPAGALTAIHKKYGDFVQTRFFSKRLLFTSNPEHYEEIFNQEARGLLNRDSLYEAKKPMFGDGLFNSKGATWTNQRRLMQPMFTKQAIAEWHGIMLKEADKAAMRLKNDGITKVNISEELKSTIQSILIQVMFGQTKSSHSEELLMSAIDTIVKGLFPHLLTETLGKGILKRLFFLQNRRMEKAINQFVAYVDSKIDEIDPEGHDLISLMMQGRDRNGAHMSRELLRDEAVTLFLAGQDTTVNTLIWFFYLIGKNEVVHKRITSEIQSLDEDPLTPETIERLIYTKAALYETLRLYPQAIALSRDTAETITVGGKTVPLGTSVIMSLYATNRDCRWWERPNEFYPEHFLNGAVTQRHKYTFLPFGGGVHNCVGRHFAELEMMVIIATVLREIKIHVNEEIKPTVSITYKPERDVIVSITPATQAM